MGDTTFVTELNRNFVKVLTYGAENLEKLKHSSVDFCYGSLLTAFPLPTSSQYNFKQHT